MTVSRSFCLSLAVVLGSWGAASLMADDHRFVLLSARDNVQRGTFHVSRTDLGIGEANWQVDKRVLRGGKQEGVDLVSIDNGTITIILIPTRGMSILDVRDSSTGERLLGWDSPVKEVVHPHYVNLESRGGLGWLDGFNEWMVRCGLEFAGHPGQDRFVTNTGDVAEMELTLHGKVGNIPASEVELIIEEQPPHRIRVRGVVHERMFFGPKLMLESELSVLPGTRSFQLTDRITNQGGADQEFQLIYHVNYGAPLLEEGARFIAAVRDVRPMNAHAAEGLGEFATYAGPTEGYIEQVYLMHPYADEEGRTAVLLQNAAGDRGTSIRYSAEQLPYLTLWKNTASVEDGYVTGIEPATGFPFNRKVERAAGRLPVLEPGDSREFSLEFSILENKQAVQAMADEIRTIQGDRPTEHVETPPEIDE
jgi:hypothetical protein